MREDARERGVVELLELASVEREVRGSRDPEHARDREPGALVVAGDDDGPHAGAPAGEHGLAHLRPRRVELAHDAEEHGSPAERLDTRLERGAGDDSDREQPQRARGHAVAGGADRCSRRGVEPRKFEHDLGGPLQGDEAPVRTRVLGRHHPHPRVERELGAPLEAPPDRGRVDSALQSEREERGLGRVAESEPARLLARRHELRVVAEDAGLDETRQRGVGLEPLPRLVELSRGGVTHAGDRDRAAARQPDLGHGHLVACERAGLVAADHGRRPERLDRREPPHDRAPGGHALDPDGERDRHGDREPLRNHGHDLAHGDRQDLGEREPPEDSQADDAGEEGHGSDEDRPPEARDLLLERRPRLLRLGGEPGDLPDLRERAGRDDDRLPAPGGHVRPRVEHVAALGEERPRVERLRALRDGQGLSRERRLGDLERRRLDEPRVGPDGVSLRDEEEVARDEVAGLDLLLAAAAEDPGLEPREAPQGRERPLGAAFLERADDGVEEHDAQDHRSVRGSGEREGDRRGAEQEVDERALELPQEDERERPSPRLGQRVRPEARPPSLHLLGREAVLRGGAQDGENFLGRVRMPQYVVRTLPRFAHDHEVNKNLANMPASAAPRDRFTPCAAGRRPPRST